MPPEFSFFYFDLTTIQSGRVRKHRSATSKWRLDGSKLARRIAQVPGGRRGGGPFASFQFKLSHGVNGM